LHVDIPLNRVLSELRKTWLAFKIFPFNLTRISLVMRLNLVPGKSVWFYTHTSRNVALD